MPMRVGRHTEIAYLLRTKGRQVIPAMYSPKTVSPVTTADA